MAEEGKIKTMKLKCSVCGSQKLAGAPRVTKLIEKFGTLEKLQNEYVCRGCRPKKAKKEIAQPIGE